MPPRIFRRVPYATAVRFEYDRFRGFVEEHSADLSLGGMFVETESAPPVGTVMPIEFRLDDGYELIRGTGKVIWVREAAEGPGRPAGMGLRFLELTAGSRELIFKVVERRAKEGEPTFDVDDAPAAAAAGAGDADAPPAEDTGELARPRWTEPPTLGGTDAEAAPSSAAAAGEAAAAAGEGAAGVGTIVERAADRPSEPAQDGRGGLDEPSAPAATPEPWEVAAPWSATPPSPRWVVADPLSGAGAPAAAEAPERDDRGSEVIFVPPEPPAPPAPRPPASVAPRSRLRRGPRRVGRWAAAAAVVLAAAAAGAWVAQDRWLGGGTTAATEEGGPGSHVLLMPEELDPVVSRRQGRGADAATAGEDGPAAAGAAGDGSGPAPGPAALAAAAPSSATGPTDLSGPAGGPEAQPPASTARPPASTARRVRDITWAARGGRTDFLIWGDGDLDPGAVSHFTIGGDRPRLVVRIPGVEEPFARGRVEVGGVLVERIRTGLHSERGRSELHVVFDLTGGSVRLAGIDDVGGRLRITLERVSLERVSLEEAGP